MTIRKMSNRWFGLIFSLALIFALASCASVPTIKTSPGMPQQSAKNILVHLTEFNDARPDAEREVIGKVFNSYGMETGQVKQPKDMISTLRKSFESELTNAGYALVNETDAIQIKADVEFVSCYYDKDRPKASIRIKFAVNEHSQEVLNRIYGGEKTGSRFESPFNFCGGPLSDSISLITSDFVKDLNEYVAS